MSAIQQPGSLTIDPILTDGVQAAVQHVLGLLTGVAPITRLLEQPVSLCDGICGTISFVGDRSWSIMVYCGRHAAMEVAEALTGSAMDYDHPDMGDAVGELTNIFAGDLIARLDSHGMQIAMGLPSVFRGTDIEVLLARNTASQWCACELPRSTFWVEIVAKPARLQPREPGHSPRV